MNSPRRALREQERACRKAGDAAQIEQTLGLELDKNRSVPSSRIPTRRVRGPGLHLASRSSPIRRYAEGEGKAGGSVGRADGEECALESLRRTNTRLQPDKSISVSSWQPQDSKHLPTSYFFLHLSWKSPESEPTHEGVKVRAVQTDTSEYPRDGLLFGHCDTV